jgi:iron complex transport system substrate-binding protein
LRLRAAHILLALAALLVTAVESLKTVRAEPIVARRIVSLNVCTDQILIELVSRQRIAAVTQLSSDPMVSAIPDAARGLAVTRGGAEEVLALDPDLVLAGPYTTPATVDLLTRLGRRVIVVALPHDLAGISDVVRRIATVTVSEARGEEVIADFERRLAVAKGLLAPLAARPSAVIYQISGLTSGSGSLADAMLNAAGFRNLAAEYLLSAAGTLSLEVLAAQPPDLLVLASAPSQYPTAVADNLRHPVLDRLSAGGHSLVLPWSLWLCGTPHIVEAIERLVAARAALSYVGPRP